MRVLACEFSGIVRDAFVVSEGFHIEGPARDESATLALNRNHGAHPRKPRRR